MHKISCLTSKCVTIDPDTFGDMRGDVFNLAGGVF